MLPCGRTSTNFLAHATTGRPHMLLVVYRNSNAHIQSSADGADPTCGTVYSDEESRRLVRRCVSYPSAHDAIQMIRRCRLRSEQAQFAYDEAALQSPALKRERRDAQQTALAALAHGPEAQLAVLTQPRQPRDHPFPCQKDAICFTRYQQFVPPRFECLQLLVLRQQLRL